MRANQHPTDFAARIAFLQNVAERVEIAERFRHLLPIDHQMRAMEPVVDELYAVGGFGLRDFVFMMREHVVDTAAMDVKRLA